jgi:hypothetical protein
MLAVTALPIENGKSSENDRGLNLGPAGFCAPREPGRMASFAGGGHARRGSQTGARELRADHSGAETADEEELVNAARSRGGYRGLRA